MAHKPVLPDLLSHNLNVVFCGTAASDLSAAAGAYYANPTNRFWRTLYNVGLTPTQMNPQQCPELLDYSIGLTDLAKCASGVDAALSADDYDVPAFQAKMRAFNPKWIAFTSKKAASVFFGQPTRQIYYGVQVKTVGTTRIWVLPSPSGAATRYWTIGPWAELAAVVRLE